MLKNYYKTYRYFIYTLIAVSILSSFRNLVLPLVFDEIQYAEIGKNIMTKGEYSLYGTPSTFTPILTFLVGLFYLKSLPSLGFVLVKLTNLLLMILGFRYCYLYLKQLNLSTSIISLIILVSAVNNATVTWSTVIYPESIVFFSFWMFIYNIRIDVDGNRQIIKFLIPLMLLIMTRYVYAVLLLIVAYVLLKYLIKLYNEKKYNAIILVAFIFFLCFLPLLAWFKYVFSIETQIDLNQSYFSRYKDNDLLYNIKSGLGLIKHNEVDKVNGIPAFISLFIPITGIRNWIISFILMMCFTIGLVANWKFKNLRILTVSILLVMVGLIFAGTGFSRYWLVFLPGFWLGFYQFFSLFKINEKYFKFFVMVLSLLYVLNEVRLDYVILTRFYQ